jgi:hypothetical protein
MALSSRPSNTTRTTRGSGSTSPGGCAPPATENRRRKGQGKPQTFDFLGFTHICGSHAGGHSAQRVAHADDRRIQDSLYQAPKIFSKNFSVADTLEHGNAVGRHPHRQILLRVH